MLVAADCELILWADGATEAELEHIVMCVNDVAMRSGYAFGASEVPNTEEFAKHWQDLPVEFKRGLRNNVRPHVSEAVRSRNSAYLVGMLAAYKDCRAIPDNAYHYARALAGSAHRFDHIAAAIIRHWADDGHIYPPKGEKA